MIAKHVPMRSRGKSDFAGLVQYITDAQSKTERLGLITLTNCEAGTVQAATDEVLATQHMNTRASGDKTFHLLVSFRAGEQPDGGELKAIEERICAGLGYGEHQRVSAVHHDTDNLHIHVAINKIHPTRKTMHDPFQSYRTLGQLCQMLERDFGLERDNHQSKRKIAEGRAADMEQHAGVESLIGWIKRECLGEIKDAKTWTDLHQVMRENGLELRQRANGFVIEAADGTMVKASTVARDLSKPKLEARLGLLEPNAEQQAERVQARREYKKRPVRSRVNTVELYAKYQDEQRTLTATRGEAWEKARGRKDRAIDAAKRSNKLRRATIKLMGGTPFAKKLLYAQAHKALRDKIQKINKQYKQERTELYEQNKRRAWTDWLKQKALQGDQQALDALRAREAAQGLKGNTIKGGGEARPGHVAVAATDNITKKGTIILRAGASAVRDDGGKLQVSRQATTTAVEEALRMAMQRYGSRITVEGTAVFKAQVIRAAVKAQLPITFADPDLERRRQSLLSNNQEKNHERHRAEPGRTDRRGISRAGPGTADQRTTGTQRTDAGEQRKPDIGRIGRVPPPQSKNRLRTLSQLGVVHILGGSEVLLPRDVPSDLEHQGAKPDNQLRRGVIGARVTPEQIAAADKYIAEREAKRLRGFGIKKHSRYTAGDGTLLFGGIRNVEGQTLALMRRDDDVLVMPIDQATANRLKRVAVGNTVSITPKGSIKTSKGRSR